MYYKQIIDGAKKYGLGDNIYDLSSLLISKYGFESKESIAGIFLLIFSWNRFYYTPPPWSNIRRAKSIDIMDMHVEKFEETIKNQIEYVKALREKALENVDYNSQIERLGVSVGDAICHLFSQFANFLGATGASKALHLLLPKLIVMWDSKIREDYEVEANADGFFRFQKRSKKVIENALIDFMKEYDVTRDEAIKRILELRHGKKIKTLAKLIDEFNWATKGQNKSHLIRE